jgi:hypothetical protein
MTAPTRPKLTEVQREIVERMAAGAALEYDVRTKSSRTLFCGNTIPVAREDYIELRRLKVIDESHSKATTYYKLTPLGRALSKGEGNGA